MKAKATHTEQEIQKNVMAWVQRTGGEVQKPSKKKNEITNSS